MPTQDILITAGTHNLMLAYYVEIAHEVSVAPLTFVVAISGWSSTISNCDMSSEAGKFLNRFMVGSYLMVGIV